MIPTITPLKCKDNQSSRPNSISTGNEAVVSTLVRSASDGSVQLVQSEV